MRSFPKGTHTAKHTRCAADAHDDAARKTPVSENAAAEAEEPRGAHSVRSTRDAHSDAVTRTSSFETADEREAARAARKGEKSEKGACAAASDAGRAKGAKAAKASAAASGAAASGAAASASGGEESAPVTFGGRFLLSLRLHVGRRERVEVVRQKKQRRSSFSLTRTVAAVALLVLCLVSTGSTMAYLTYTANAAVNRTTSGAVDIKVVELTSASAEAQEFDSGTNTADGAIDGKQVSVKNPEGDNAVPVVVRLSFVPEVEALAADGTTKTGANQFMSETWSEPEQDSNNNWILKGEIVTIYLARGWKDNWTYSDGAFYYKKVLNPGETTITKDNDGNSVGLMTGITMADGQNKADYGTIKVNVFADAIQSTPSSATDPTEGAPGAWNCTVAADGTVTKVMS